MSEAKTWTKERVALLTKMWCTDGLTASEIASRLRGVTREAVCGKVKRLNLVKRVSPNDRKVPTKINTGNGGSKSRAPEISPDFTMPPKQDFDVARKKLADLELEDCRFPVDREDGNGFGFCALDAVPGKPYCLEHCQRAYQAQPVPSRQKVPANDEMVEA